MFTGLDLDSQESQSKGYRFAKNLKKTGSFLQNEEGNRFLFTLEGEIKGEITTPTDLVIFTTNTIYWYKNDVFQHSIKTNVEFSEIHGVFQYNFKNEFIICFTDSVNPIGYLNLSELKQKNITYLDYTDMYLFKNKQIPIINCTPIKTGNLEAGSYRVYVRYIEKDETATNFIGYGDFTFISNENKGIDIKLTNLDKSYLYVELAVIKNINDIETASLITRLQISDVLEYTYEGNETEQVLSPEDILVNYVAYPYANTITSHENYLAIGGLRTIDYNEQEEFSKIKINWLRLKNNDTLKEKKTFTPGEVYAFYARGIDFAGNRTRWFLIPYNDSSSSGFSSEYEFIKSIKNINQNEKFENGKNVEHYLCNVELDDSLNPTHSYFDISSLNIEELKKRYQKIEYGIAKRTWKNKRVLGFDIGIFNGIADLRSRQGAGNENSLDNYYRNNTTNTALTSCAGNWAIGSSNDNVTIYPIANYLRVHSPEMMIDKPNININKIQLLKKAKFLVNNGIGLNDADWSWWKGRTIVSSFDKFNQEDKVITKEIELFNPNEQYYIGGNNVITNGLKQTNITIVNRRCEPYRLIQLNNYERLENKYNTPALIGYHEVFKSWETFYYALISEKEDYYKDYYNQEVVSLGVYEFENAIVKGDSYLCNHSLSLYSPVASGCYENDDYIINSRFTLKIHSQSAHRHHIVYPTICQYDLDNRTEEIESNTKFYPLSPRQFADDFDFLSKDIDTKVNLREGFKKSNTTIGVVNNPLSEYLSDFPFRVAGSLQQTPEDKVGNWRLFKALDYFEMPKTRGKVVGLSSMQEKLLIHTEYALFITRGQEELQTDSSTIYLSRLNLYKQRPIELYYTLEGYSGLKNKKNSKLTKIGYIWGNNGRIFNFQEEIKEISQQGLRKFFRDNGTDDISIAFDDFNERLFISSPKYTLSFRDNVFVSFHDFLTSRIFSVGKRIYSVNKSEIWKHDSIRFSNYYGVNYPAFIDYLTNGNINKYLFSISWITSVQENNKNYDYTQTFHKAHIRTENQCSGTIKLNNFNEIRISQGVWNFNMFRDLLKQDQPITNGVSENFDIIENNIDYKKPWYLRKKFNVNDWYIIRLSYENNDSQITIKQISPNFKPSAR